MELPAKKDQLTFARKTSFTYRRHRRQVANTKQELGFTLEDLRALVRAASVCPFCGLALTPETFSVTHRLPISRHGDDRLANLLVACAPCVRAKGLLADTEFAALMAVSRHWPREARANLLARLRQGTGRRWSTF